MASPVLKLAENNTGDAGSLIHVANNAQIEERERLKREAAAAQNTLPVSALSSHLSGIFNANQQYRERSGVDAQMIASLYQRNNEYDSNKITEILRQGGTDVFMGLTGVKCRAAEAWLTDVMASDRKKSWSLSPTPIPDLDEETTNQVIQKTMMTWQQSMQDHGQGVGAEGMGPKDVAGSAHQLREQMLEAMQDEAEQKADAMEVKIADQFIDGGWYNEFDDFITDVTTLKAGIMKGPVMERKQRLEWKKSAFGGKVPKPVWDTIQVYKRVNPLDMYPSDGSIKINDGSLVERIRYSRKSLRAMRGIKGYDKGAIDLVLQRYGKGGLRMHLNIDQMRADIEDKSTLDFYKDFIEGKEYWCSVFGQLLLDRGIFRTPDNKPVVAEEEYEINAIQIGSFLVYVDFNPDPLGRRPYAKTGWGKVPGSWWYKGIPELMRDLQGICNASVRALVNNLGIASGPQVIINDINSIAPGEKVTSMYPWKIWQCVRKMQMQGKQIDFFQPKSNANELLAIYDFFAKLADDYTGIPAYSYGNDKVAGAGRTMGGLAMLMSNASRGLKKVISRIDQDIIADRVGAQYDWNMQFDPDQAIKGDVEIVVGGTLAVLQQEQLAAQRMEYIQTIGANPLAQRIMGIEGYANLLRSTQGVLQLEDDIIPNKEKMKAVIERMKAEDAAAAQAQQQQQAQKVAA